VESVTSTDKSQPFKTTTTASRRF